MWHPGIPDGRKWRLREEMGGKFLPTRAKIVFLYHKYFFAEHALSEQIILNEVSLVRKPHNFCCPGLYQTTVVMLWVYTPPK